VDGHLVIMQCEDHFIASDLNAARLNNLMMEGARDVAEAVNALPRATRSIHAGSDSLQKTKRAILPRPRVL
jgi:hypothetical protein